MLKLHSRAASPFAARVRIAARFKGVELDIVEGPDPSTDSFSAISPLRRVPVLVTESGSYMPESAVIVQYLNEIVAEPPLMPDDPVDRATARLLERVADLYLMPATVDLLRGSGDLTTIREALQNIVLLAGEEGASWFLVGDRFSSADAAVAPVLFFVNLAGRRAGVDLIGEHALLDRFMSGAKASEPTATVLNEMAAGMGMKSS